MTPAQLLIALIATVGGILFIALLWRWATQKTDQARYQQEHDLAEQDGEGDYQYDLQTGKRKPLR